MKISEHDRSVSATESVGYQESIHTVMSKLLLFIFACKELAIRLPR
jgi:hypothetical protein